MCQEEVLKILENGGRHTAVSISKSINVGRHSVSTSLRKLVKQGYAEIIIARENGRRQFYYTEKKV